MTLDGLFQPQFSVCFWRYFKSSVLVKIKIETLVDSYVGAWFPHGNLRRLVAAIKEGVLSFLYADEDLGFHCDNGWTCFSFSVVSYGI